jgi:purine-nucleoside phosphorylase
MSFGTDRGINGEESEFARAERAAEFVRSSSSLRPQIALVLGSGLGAFADQLQQPVRIPYREIPHYPLPSAAGHAGRLVIGKVGDVAVAAMQGRVHLYEGHSIKDVVFPMRVFGRMGIRAAILTNAAGGISSQLMPGCLVVLRDHMNLQGAHPLIGPNDDRFGARFLDMTTAYCKTYQEVALAEGRRLNLDIFPGVYAALTGPTYETPAEIKYLRAIGADVVGMSTVPEVIVAVHAGLRVLGLSVITDMCLPDHLEVATVEKILAVARSAEPKLSAIITAAVRHAGG